MSIAKGNREGEEKVRNLIAPLAMPSPARLTRLADGAAVALCTPPPPAAVHTDAMHVSASSRIKRCEGVCAGEKAGGGTSRQSRIL